MYLSKLSFDVRHPSVIQALKNPQDMHRNLMRAFEAQGASRKEAKLLYRLDVPRAALLVSSQALPAWERVPGYCCEGIKEIEALKKAFIRGRCLNFELLAIPAKKVKREGRHSHRVFLRGKEERADWLKRQGVKYGFELVCPPAQSPSCQIDGAKDGMNICYTAVCFSGTLRITDPEAFWHAYTEGVGAGKAYGLGMLSVKKRE